MEVLREFPVWKKQSVQTLAEVLEDGREIMNTEMKKPKYNNYARIANPGAQSSVGKTDLLNGWKAIVPFGRLFKGIAQVQYVCLLPGT